MSIIPALYIYVLKYDKLLPPRLGEEFLDITILQVLYKRTPLHNISLHNVCEENKSEKDFCFEKYNYLR